VLFPNQKEIMFKLIASIPSKFLNLLKYDFYCRQL